MSEITTVAADAGIREFLSAEVAIISTLHRPRANGYLCPLDFVLKNGRAWTPKALPLHVRNGTAQQCFQNSQILALEHEGDLMYCEGYAAGVIPVLHAWCVNRTGEIIDPTWTGKPKSRAELGKEYFGVAFNYGYVAARMLATEMHHCLIDDWENGWPLFTAPVEIWRHPINDL